MHLPWAQVMHASCGWESLASNVALSARDAGIPVHTIPRLVRFNLSPTRTEFSTTTTITEYVACATPGPIRVVHPNLGHGPVVFHTATVTLPTSTKTTYACGTTTGSNMVTLMARHTAEPVTLQVTCTTS